MMSFLVYEGKAAVALLVFYLFYRFLLKKETFHRFNRIVLVGTVVLSFLLPLCIITVHRPMETVTGGNVLPVEIVDASVSRPVEKSVPLLQTLLVVLFWAGVVFVLVREIVSILSILSIVRNGETAGEEDGCRVIVTDKDIDPFSWMRYVVLSRKEWEGPHKMIIAHEKAHIDYGHSVELLLVDLFSAFQWFNPAIWMLRSDLQELHEYEADDAVLRSGTNLKEYQYLLIRKAVGKSGYSVANSLNHSILKNRITMMSKSKSPLMRGLRVLYLLPLICLGLGLQARTVYVQSGEVNENGGIRMALLADGATPIIILRQFWGEEKEITSEEFSQLDDSKISSIQLVKDASTREKYGEKAADGVIVITLKRPQELEGIVVVRYDDDEGPYPFYLVEPDTMPVFQGGDMNEFSRWLNRRIEVPKSCKHSGTMKISFVVAEDGSVRDVKILESVCEELDALMLSLVSKSPKWEPATSNGRPVAQNLSIPVKFELR